MLDPEERKEMLEEFRAVTKMSIELGIEEMIIIILQESQDKVSRDVERVILTLRGEE